MNWGLVHTELARVSVQLAVALLLVRMTCWTGDVAQLLERLSRIRACLRPSWNWLLTSCLPWTEPCKIR